MTRVVLSQLRWVQLWIVWLAGVSVACEASVHPRVGKGIPPPDWVEVEKPPLPEEEPAKGAATAEVGPHEIAARHVLIAYRGASQAAPSIVRTRADALRRAQEALSRLRAGEDFGVVATNYTDEPGGAERQGDLGRFTRDKMVKRFSDAAFALSPGQVSEVVETQYGFHVIQRTE